MIAVIQRVKEASVKIDSVILGTIDYGLLVLLGVGSEDSEIDARWMAEKIVNLRVFRDQNDKMNLSLKDVGGNLLAVSQFTLYGECEKGRRPSFSTAANPEKAEHLYKLFCDHVTNLNIVVKTGQFQTHMEVSLVNDGPVTLILRSPSERGK